MDIQLIVQMIRFKDILYLDVILVSIYIYIYRPMSCMVGIK